MKNIVDKREIISNITAQEVSSPVNVSDAKTWSYHVVVDVDTPSAKTFLAGVAASLVNQGVTYTSKTRSAAGNSKTVQLVDTAVPSQALEVTEVANAIIINLELDGAGVILSTADDIVSLVNGDPTLSILASGTGATALVVTAPTSLTGGVDSAVDVSTDTITKTAHGLSHNLKGQLTTSTGSLPAGLSLATDYFVIVVDADSFQLSATANGAAVDITDQGTSGTTFTFTPTVLASASVKPQQSNDSVHWSDITTAITITQDGAIYLSQVDPTSKWVRLSFGITAGRMQVVNHILAKG